MRDGGRMKMAGSQALETRVVGMPGGVRSRWSRRPRKLFMLIAATFGSVGVGSIGAAFLAPSVGAATTTLTVSTTGTDTGNCQAANCATLGYALSQAAAG